MAKAINRQPASTLDDQVFLLVLDNFEQVIAAAPILADLVTRCRRLTILVTSRAVLRISGEHDVVVPPLGLPGASRGRGTVDMSRYPAIQLFVDRARAAHDNFALTDANTEAVAAICTRLNGLPLAIELAAARSRVLSPRALLARLEQRLPLLTGGPRDQPARLRTMRDAIAWSYDLLGEREQALFRRLSVFAGGYTEEAAAAVLGTGARPADVFERLIALEGASLVSQAEQPDGELRFAMFETIREFGLERLTASGEETETRAAHAAYFLALSETGQGLMQPPDRRAWLERLELEHDNLRGALAWAIDQGDADTAQRLVAAIWLNVWIVRGELNEGRDWITRARALGPSSSLEVDASVLFAASEFAGFSGEIERAIPLAEEALVIARMTQNDQTIGRALVHLANAVGDRDGQKQVEPLLLDAVALLGAADVWDARIDAATAFHNLAVIASLQGDTERVETLAVQALAGWEDLGSGWGRSGTLDLLANTARASGDVARAITLAREALSLRWAHPDTMYLIDSLAVVARIAFASGQPHVAARLWGAAELLAEEIRFVAPPEFRYSGASDLAALRALLGDEAFAREWAAGRSLTLEQAVTEALAFDPGAPVADRERRPDARFGLTPREFEVLRLLAEWRTDREIAEALFVSRRTINAHVAHLLAKLGVSSRREAVTRARASGLLVGDAEP